MKLTLLLPARPDARWAYARQIGVTHAVTKAAPELSGLAAPDDLDALRAVRDRFAEAGIRLIGLEGDQFDMTRIKLGLPGREQDADRYRRMLINMGELGLGLLCYNFMARPPGAAHDWHRTDVNLPLRGGSIGTSFDAAAVPAAKALSLAESQLWENYTWFIRSVIPAAEQAGVTMGLHPDDPPVGMLGGVARLFGTPQAFDRAYDLAPSRSNGVTFCQANFRLMGLDDRGLMDWSARFAAQGRLAFVHFRDVRGTATRFTETWHDEGPTDMAAMLRHYHQIGFRGPIRDDHVPTMHGESADVPGYGALGHLFAVGYMKGIAAASGVELE